jgi:hypothetical protein
MGRTDTSVRSEALTTVTLGASAGIDVLAAVTEESMWDLRFSQL